MYLHLGNGYMIPLKDIVMLADLESTTQSQKTREFLKTAREEGFVEDLSGGEPKSFVIANEKVYLSLISTNTLEKRAQEEISSLS
ncbi:MAG: extracellular matrix/biofilm biosynthesis regulator RemA family protein [Halanaerobium sp.]|nr:extracellular matrix/biofilm biosynthesis regulator RemA family protein [Halanaerobium sp.]